MQPEDWFNLVGLALQLIGVPITVYGFRQMWHALKDQAARLRRPSRQLARDAHDVIALVDHATVSATAYAVGLHVDWAPLPGDPHEAIELMDRRMRDIQGMIESDRARLQEQSKELQEQSNELADHAKNMADLGTRVAEVDSRLAEVATAEPEGLPIRTAGVGVALIMIGLGLQIVAIFA